jgi:hypothetical protein
MNFAPGIRGWLSSLLQQPEIIALIETAPAEMSRPIRSLIWMLDFPKQEIPAILRRPRKPRQPKIPSPETADSPREETPVPISWKKPRGSISNRIYRNYRPPGTRPPPKTA